MKPSTISKAPPALVVLTAVIFILPMPCRGALRPGANPDDRAKRAVVVRATSRLVIDGMLDEPDWSEAQPIGEILQREPRPGEAATEPTQVKLLYDAQNLYIGVVCSDSQPERIIATQMARDAQLSVDDRIEIVLDTFRDRRNAFYFATNPAGALVDGLIVENGQLNMEWDAIWNVRTHRFFGGWSAEFAIPFKSLAFNKGQGSWGFNFSRTIKRKLEEDRWASPRRDVRFFQVSEAGEISGISGIAQGLGLDIRPYVSGKWLRRGQTDDDVVLGKVGGDIFYNITPNLKWTTTFNTDFTETEVDNRQINLTRFPLFFPEKRAFFLENAGVFNFSNFSTGSPDILPFFSRRIGLLSGREIPILAGTRLTGKTGRYDIGVVDVRTGETDFAAGKNIFVGRVKRTIFKQSYVGGIFTDGDPARPAASRIYGADIRLATARFLGFDRNFSIDAFALKTPSSRVQGEDGAFGVSASYPNDLWDIRADWRQIGRDFRPALGFVPRTNVRKLFISAEFDPRPRCFLNLRQMFHEFRYTRFTRLDDGRLESWRVFTAPVNYLLNSGDRVELNFVPTFERLFRSFEIANFERLFRSFEIANGVVLPPGDCRFIRWRAEFGTASKRRWQVDATWWFGTFWSGHADEIETTVQYKLAPRLQIALELEQTFARLKEGNFVARILNLQANYSLTPFLTFFNLVQFDNESRNLGWQSRVRWILRPGSEVFLVFHQGRRQEEGGGFHFRPPDSGLAIKIQHTFRF